MEQFTDTCIEIVVWNKFTLESDDELKSAQELNWIVSVCV